MAWPTKHLHVVVSFASESPIVHMVQLKALLALAAFALAAYSEDTVAKGKPIWACEVFVIGFIPQVP
jgi:hypothetical protein